MLKKNQIITDVEIIDYTHQGLGVAKYEDIAIFVKYAKLHDKINVKITRVEKTFCYGLNLSLAKVEAICPHYKQCGGCQTMHLTYDEQIEFKTRLVQNLANKYKIKTTINECLKAEDQFYYRNKVQMPFTMIDGEIALGFFKERSHEVIKIDKCFLQSEVANQIKDEVLVMLNEAGETVYNEDTQNGNLRHLFIRQGFNTSDIMVCFVVNSKAIKNQKQIAKALVEKFPAIKSIVVNENTRKTNAVLGFKNYNLYNKNMIVEKLNDLSFEVAPNAFFQVHTKQTIKLYDLVVKYADFKKTDVLLDAYCGSGSIGLYCADKVKSVVGIEIVKPAIDNANKNQKLNKISNAKFICNDIEKEILNYQDAFFDVVVVDPPRKGLETNFINTLLKFKPKRVVYVSCNPDSLMRDLTKLQEVYKVVEITPVDMFSQTYHVESVVKLVLK